MWVVNGKLVQARGSVARLYRAGLKNLVLRLRHDGTVRLCVPPFDVMSLSQRLVCLSLSARDLLHRGRPSVFPTLHLESAIAAVFRHIEQATKCETWFEPDLQVKWTGLVRAANLQERKRLALRPGQFRSTRTLWQLCDLYTAANWLGLMEHLANESDPEGAWRARGRGLLRRGAVDVEPRDEFFTSSPPVTDVEAVGQAVSTLSKLIRNPLSDWPLIEPDLAVKPAMLPGRAQRRIII